MKDRSRLATTLALTLALGVGVATAQVTGNFGTPPRLLPYQGFLEDGGVPVTGTMTMTFFLVTAPATDLAGAVWQEEHVDVPIAAGRFSVALGQTTPITSQLDAAELYVGVVVAGVELTGKQRLMSAAHAVTAAEARNFTVRGALDVNGTTSLHGAVFADEAADFAKGVAVGGDVQVDGALNVSGAANVAGALTAPNADAIVRDIKLSKEWSAYPASGTGRAEISNDTTTYKTLMIAGNRSGGGTRQVGVWDDLRVNGNLTVTGDLIAGANQTTCSESNTTCADDGGGSTTYLDRHDMYCPVGQFMRGWRLERCNSNNGVRFYYSCCTF